MKSLAVRVPFFCLVVLSLSSCEAARKFGSDFDKFGTGLRAQFQGKKTPVAKAGKASRTRAAHHRAKAVVRDRQARISTAAPVDPEAIETAPEAKPDPPGGRRWAPCCRVRRRGPPGRATTRRNTADRSAKALRMEKASGARPTAIAMSARSGTGSSMAGHIFLARRRALRRRFPGWKIPGERRLVHGERRPLHRRGARR